MGGIRDGRYQAGARRAQKMRPPPLAGIDRGGAREPTGAVGSIGRKLRQTGQASLRQRQTGRQKAAAEAADIQETRVKAGATAGSDLIDAETGGVLHEIKPDMPAYPASLTKMMTLYLTFAALNQDTLDLNQRLVVSRHAARQEPSKLWLKVGDLVRVKNLILALVTRSANDAAVVLAEGLAGSEAAFAERMTAKARQLGMTNTVFRNASGLPDPAQRTTARDMARLALALEQEFPREFDYFSVREFEFRGQTITGHNHLLKTYKGSDGIKTGFTRAAGFNLVASAERKDRRLIAVILGSPSWGVRDKQMVALLDRGFAGPGSNLIANAPDMVVPSPGQTPRFRGDGKTGYACVTYSEGGSSR